MAAEPRTPDDLIAAARAAEAVGDWDSALARLDEALAAARAAGDLRTAAAVLRSCGRVHFDRGRLDAAAGCYHEALATARALDERRGMAGALNGLAVVAQFRGQLAEAEKLFGQAGEQADALGDDGLAAQVRQNLGILANMRGDPGLALRHYASALERLHRLGDLRAEAAVLNNMGITRTGLSDWNEAELCFSSALDLAERAGDVRTVARVWVNRAEMYLKRQHYEAAREAVDRAFRLSGRIGSDAGLCVAYKAYGMLYRETGRPRMAEIQLELALQLARTCGLRLPEAEVLDESARLHLQQGRWREALRALNGAHAIFADLAARRELIDVDRRITRLEDVYLRALALLRSEAIAADELQTAARHERIAALTCGVAEALGLPGREITWLRLAAYLHDVGRGTIPSSILGKPGVPTADEWELVKQHPAASAAIVADLDFPAEILPAIRHHHERWDGGGYPDGLAGERIPLPARILALADTYDALTSDRPYRPAFAPDDALTLMHAEAGRQLDPELFRVFRSVLGAGAGRALLSGPSARL